MTQSSIIFVKMFPFEASIRVNTHTHEQTWFMRFRTAKRIPQSFQVVCAQKRGTVLYPTINRQELAVAEQYQHNSRFSLPQRQQSMLQQSSLCLHKTDRKASQVYVYIEQKEKRAENNTDKLDNKQHYQTK